jgi:VWFA-related protein
MRAPSSSSSSRCSRRRSPALLTLLACAAGAAALAPAGAQTFEGTSQVLAVEVPVNVVGKDGEPVRGMTADDFEVYDGNDRQKVSGFEVVDLKTLESEPAGAASPASRAPVELPPAARRHFLFLFDLSFSSPTSILKARVAARDFILHSLHPWDLAAVATYSLENGPKLVVTFTPDRAQLARAIDTLGYRRAFDNAGETRNDPLRFMLEPPVDASPQTMDAGTQANLRNPDLQAQKEQILYDYLQAISAASAKSDRQFEVGQISNYSRALGEIARKLNAVQGRKNVIFFSEGFDSRLLLGRQTTDQDAEDDNLSAMFGEIWKVDNDQRYGNTGLQGMLLRMLEEFRRADCVIQAVDIGGLRAGSDERARPSGVEALFYMANETGGELFKDANNLSEPLARVLDHTSVTYLLTFERSDVKADGSYHKLRVKAKLPPGARLVSRTGYYAPRPYKELDPLEKTLLASDRIARAVPKRDIALDVLTTAFRATEARAYVPVIVEAGGASLLEGQKGKKLDVEIYAYVSDLQGQMRDFLNQRIALDLDRGKSRQSLLEGGIKYYGHFDLPPGDYNVRVLVRNAESGRTGVATRAVNVPVYSQAQPVLLPPFFMEERQKWLLVREQGRNQPQGSAVVYPFTVSGEPYVPSARPILQDQKTARLCLVAYNLGKGDLAVQGEVLAADGKSSLAGKLAHVERTATGIQGLDKLVATFDPAGLRSGDYVLRVGVTDPATGLRHTNSLPFQVIH